MYSLSLTTAFYVKKQSLFLLNENYLHVRRIYENEKYFLHIMFYVQFIIHFMTIFTDF